MIEIQEVDGITVTDHQRQAIQQVIDLILDGERVIAFKGLAGTGKSYIIPVLKATFTADVSAPTHKACKVLRERGMGDVETVYQRSMRPVFTDEFEAAREHLEYDSLPSPSRRPELIPEEDYDTCCANVSLGGPERALASVGIKAGDYLVGFTEADYQGGVLIVDEASMLGQEAIDKVLKVYDTVILVGDHGQLPPVGEDPVLLTVPGPELTEVLRQQADSGIVRLAYQVRKGQPLSANGDDVIRLRGQSAEAFRTAPVMVWRNRTREQFTAWVRRELGYTNGQPQKGEKIICRSTYASDRKQGFLNNGVWTVLETNEFGLVLLSPEGKEDEEHTHRWVQAHMEEYDGRRVDPGAILFRYSYALTVHTAQGSSWDEVHIHLNDYKAFFGMCASRKSDDVHKWAYTALTRAKKRVYLLGR